MVFLLTYRKHLILFNMFFLLSKPEYYYIHGRTNECFILYLSSTKQFTSINGYDFNFAAVKISTPQGTVLGSTFILNLHHWFKESQEFCKVNHSVTLLMTQTYFILVNRLINLIKIVNLDIKFCFLYKRVQKFCESG